jgi:cytochrome oxidase Cu insertion factor (SCO1/SenC/PrrC family)
VEDVYNYEHFTSRHLLEDLATTIKGTGLEAGDLAPDFELPSTTGERFRLSEHRGRPVLLRFGSYS